MTKQQKNECIKNKIIYIHKMWRNKKKIEAYKSKETHGKIIFV